MANGNSFDITDLIKLMEYNQQGSNGVDDAVNAMMPVNVQELGAQSQMDAIIALNDIKNIENEQSWGSRADKAWFPQGGKLFPEILGDKLQVPEGSGDIMNFLMSLWTGGRAVKGGKILADEGKRAFKRHGMKPLGSKVGEKGGTSMYPGNQSIYQKGYKRPTGSTEEEILRQFPETNLGKLLREYQGNIASGPYGDKFLKQRDKILQLLREYNYRTRSIIGPKETDIRGLADKLTKSVNKPGSLDAIKARNVQGATNLQLEKVLKAYGIKQDPNNPLSLIEALIKLSGKN